MLELSKLSNKSNLKELIASLKQSMTGKAQFIFFYFSSIEDIFILGRKLKKTSMKFRDFVDISEFPNILPL